MPYTEHLVTQLEYARQNARSSEREQAEYWQGYRDGLTQAIAIATSQPPKEPAE